MSLSKAALLTAFFIFPASLLRPVGGWLSDRFGARPVTYGVFAPMLAACVAPVAPARRLGTAGPFFLLVEVLGVGMGLGKASVYKYIPEYFPKDVGATGGLVGTLGALGGFFLPIGFGYLEEASRPPRELLLADDGADGLLPGLAAPGRRRHPPAGARRRNSRLARLARKKDRRACRSGGRSDVVAVGGTAMTQTTGTNLLNDDGTASIATALLMSHRAFPPRHRPVRDRAARPRPR